MSYKPKHVVCMNLYKCVFSILSIVDFLKEIIKWFKKTSVYTVNKMIS